MCEDVYRRCLMYKRSRSSYALLKGKLSEAKLYTRRHVELTQVNPNLAYPAFITPIITRLETELEPLVNTQTPPPVVS